MFKKILFLLPVLLVIAAAVYILRFNPWRVESESVSLQNVDCVSESQIAADVPLRGQNLLLLNENQIAGKIKSKYICVKMVSVKRVFPNKVSVVVLGRTPSIVLVPKSLDASTSAQVANFLSDINPNEATPSSQSALIEDLIKSPNVNYSGVSFLVDIEGVVYSNMNALQNLPKIIFYGSNIQIGSTIDPRIVTGSITVLQKLSNFAIPVNLAMVEGEDLGVKSPQGLYFFALDSDVDRELASLQLILQTSKINEEQNSSGKTGYKNMSSIDLRFNKPVVVYSQK